MKNLRRCKMCRKTIKSGGIVTPKLRFCSWDCLNEYRTTPAAAQMAKKMERIELTDRKERLKSIETHIRDAQREFNSYIRARDKNRNCISCDRDLSDTRDTKGFDCGHYISRSLTGKGSSKWRFHPRGCAGQCKRCNRWASGNFVQMRKGLVERFGIDQIERMENDNVERKFTLSELERIKKVFRRRRMLYERKFR